MSSTRDIAKDLAAVSAKKSECVKVVVRVRPLSKKEKQNGFVKIAAVDSEYASITMKKPNSKDDPKTFTYDQTYDDDSTQEEIYNKAASPIVDSVCEGFNGTVFAYGQTGAGKTFTMRGEQDPPEFRGILPRCFKHIMDKISSMSGNSAVQCSYLEIYNETIRDLLVRKKEQNLKLKEHAEHGWYVKDLTNKAITSVAELESLMNLGNKNRTTAATEMNAESSRSHSIFQIQVETVVESKDGQQHIRAGKLNLVDLAGSERAGKTKATGQQFLEGVKINLSLTVLGQVINALVEGKSKHVPYRESKLTKLLQDSLGGNTKTVMIANVGPADYNFDETTNTLKYASRAKSIKNKPKINEDPKDAMLREQLEEINRLKKLLAEKQAKMGPGSSSGGIGGATPFGKPKVLIQTQIQTKVVERIETKDTREEKIKELKERAEREKEEKRRKMEKEREEILMKKGEISKKGKELLAELKKKEEEEKQAMKEAESIKKQLKEFEQQIIQGGKELDKAAQKEIELRRINVELEERRHRQQKLEEELRKQEIENITKEEEYNSLADEAQDKSRKLEKLWNKIQQYKSEVRDRQSQFAKEREEMLEAVRELTQKIAAQDLIVDQFIPPVEAKKVCDRLNYDEDQDEFVLDPIAPPSNPTRSHRIKRPIQSEFAKSRQRFDQSTRFRRDNLLTYELSHAPRCTEEYDGEAAEQTLDVSFSEEIIHFSVEDIPDWVEKGSSSQLPAVIFPSHMVEQAANQKR